MRIKTIIVTIAVFSFFNGIAQKYPYQNSKLLVEKRVEDLLLN